jgi:pantothenate kinase|tara:strand:- start:4045 stop:4392 length:348 start_codon:yes stop_codon:yes gene_type:complete
MTKFYLLDETRQQVRRILQFKGDVKAISVDCSPWADDNGTVTTATWSVESGSVSIGTEALASNVASAILTTSESGSSSVKLVITDGTHSEAVYFKVKCKDPQVATAVPDYNLQFV